MMVNVALVLTEKAAHEGDRFERISQRLATKKKDQCEKKRGEKEEERGREGERKYACVCECVCE